MGTSILDQLNKAFIGAKITVKIEDGKVVQILYFIPPTTIEHRTRPHNTYRIVACGRNPKHCDEWNCCQMKESSQC